jgi:hypothetical protein
MPIESVLRASDGSIVTICDKGPTVLWVSPDDGVSWNMPEGHIRGKHAAVVQLADGRLMALGRSNNIQGRMPMSVSKDMGRTWDYRASVFDPVKWGQRPVLLRLREGPLLFSSFCRKMPVENTEGKQHLVSGLFAAVSFDEGDSWPHRRLVTDDGPGRQIATLNGMPVTLDAHRSEFAGYLAVCQGIDGMIHILTSRQHYSFNLEWLLEKPPPAAFEPVPPRVEPLVPKDNLVELYKPEKLTDSPAVTELGPVGDIRIGLARIDSTGGPGLSLRSGDDEPFGGVDPATGFTAEIRTRVLRSQPGRKGVDLELYDGGCARYAITVTADGVFWYEGHIVGSDYLPFNEHTRLGGEFDNRSRMHTYRVAVRPDRVAQIYRDGELIAVRRYEYRTPRAAYIQFGADAGVSAIVDYVSYDLAGPAAPAGLKKEIAGGEEW